jgi:transposase
VDRPTIAQPDFFDLPSVQTLNIKQTEPHYQVEAEPSSRPAHCHACGTNASKLYRHDTREQKIKDTLVRGKQVLIRLYRYRYKCSQCGHITQQLLKGIDHRGRMTERLREHIEQETLKADESFRKISIKFGVDEKAVRDIFTRLMKRLSRSWRFEAPRYLGIDEVYIQGVARCIVTDVENRHVINILPKREMLTLRRHLLQIKYPKRIEVVVIDMWRPYFEEALKRFPDAVVVIDKFHVMRMATEAVISVHRRLRRANKHLSLPKIYLLRKRKHKLPQLKEVELNSRLELLPELAEAYGLKEDFLNIWNCLDKSDADQRFDGWTRKIPHYLLDDFKALLTALNNWRKEILNYFDYRITNAFTESVNNIIKHMQRVGRGYTFEVTRAKMIYGSPFLARGSRDTAIRKNNQAQTNPNVKRKKRAKRADVPPNPKANIQQLKRIRRSEDEFNELMRPPAGFVERFKHFKQLDFTF